MLGVSWEDTEGFGLNFTHSLKAGISAEGKTINHRN